MNGAASAIVVAARLTMVLYRADLGALATPASSLQGANHVSSGGGSQDGLAPRAGDYVVTDDCDKTCLLGKAQQASVHPELTLAPMENLARTSVFANGRLTDCTRWTWVDRDSERVPQDIFMEMCDPDCFQSRFLNCTQTPQRLTFLVAVKGNDSAEGSRRAYVARSWWHRYGMCSCVFKDDRQPS